MSKRRILIVTICVYSAMFFAQAAWESPLRPFVWWWTTPGCWFAWLIATPDYDKKSTVWLFDLIASVVNTVVYLAALWLIRAIYLMGKGQLRARSRRLP